jgi:hypothetical protein
VPRVVAPSLQAKARELRRWHDLILSTDGPRNKEAKLVALAIAHHVDWSTFSTFVGVETIVTVTDICEKTVRDRIQKLIREGFLAARKIGRGRTWKLRELTLGWPASPAGHEDSRPVKDTGHEAPRPVDGVSMTGTAAPHDRHGVHPISSEITKEISSKSAAPPSPAEAGSAALPKKAAFVLSLAGKGFKQDEIAKYGKTQFALTTEQVNRIISSRGADCGD